jgi:DNA polymerase IV
VGTVGALAALSDARLSQLLAGRVGSELRDRARGIDPREVSGEAGEAVSISSEETFERDVADRAELHAELRRMAEGLARSLASRGLVARTVTAKLRYPDFSIATRSQSLPVGIDEAAEIGDLACRLLDRALSQRPGALRLAGVAVSGLERHKQLALPVDDPEAA